MRYLSEHSNLKVGKVILVAPSLNPEKTWGKEMFNFTIDQNLMNRVEELVIFNSTDDHAAIQETVRILREAFPKLSYKEFTNMGHFTVADMPSSEFPELVSEILS